VPGAGAPPITLDPPDATAEPVVTAADKLRAMRERTPPDPAASVDRARGVRLDFGERTERPAAGLFDRAEPPAASGETTAAPAAGADATVPPAAAATRSPAAPRTRTWRDPLAVFGSELVRGNEAELPSVATDTELGRLAQRLGLTSAARRALAALYGAYLVGEPQVALARLAHALGDWTEALGQGELAALAMLRRRGGKIALRGSVSDVLDGAPPRAIRVIGDAATAPPRGALRLSREGRSDAAIESELAGQLGRIAVIEGGAALALLEARLHGATAVAFAAPPHRPLPWPRGAGLIIVAEAVVPDWVAALPELTAA